MLVVVSVVVLLVLAVLLAIAFGFFIYKDWQRSQHVSDAGQKLINEE
ncbi:hypothetical protein [Spiroplasma sp. SV19]|nr:hypothetical protein [Spiroplasma sp. SV19]